MNLPVSRTLLSFAFAFSLFSCDDPSDIGLELQGSVNQIGTSFRDDFQINASTVLLKDSLVSFAARPVLAGRVNDGPFGTITTRAFAEVSLPLNNLNFSATPDAPAPVADSIVLSLGYNYYFGDTTLTTGLSVYELDEAFFDKTTYFTTSTLRTKPTALGSVSFRPRPTPFRPAGAAATVARSTPTIKIRLSQELATRILAESGKPPLANQENFVAQVLKGISIEPSPNAPAGAVLGFNLQSDSSYINLRYTSDGTKRSVKFRFFDMEPRFNQITADFTGTPLANLRNSGDIVPSTQTDNVAYIQSGTGLRTKITFPDLASLRNEGGTLAINRAELVVPLQIDLFDQSRVPPLVYLYETNETNRILTFNDGVTPRRVQRDGGQYLFGGGQPAELEYDSEKRHYVVNMTSYVQAMLYGTKPNNGLLIGSGANSNLINRAVIPASATERIRLRVYYTRVTN
jgi:hypothetical protein